MSRVAFADSDHGTHTSSTHCSSVVSVLVSVAGAALVAGCTSSFEEIDRQVHDLLAETSSAMNASAPDASKYPPEAYEQRTRGLSIADADYAAEFVPTTNPRAEELNFVPAQFSPEDEATAITERLESTIDEVGRELDLNLALQYAQANSREYQTAVEDYLLAALRLLIERHRWGPQFFNETSATFDAVGDDHVYDTALSLVNEFGVTYQLPYGGEVSARALASATEQLHQEVASDDVNSADIVLSANIPLLRGSGIAARDSRISAERELIYAARQFERFRRQFLFSLVQDYLNLVLQRQSIANLERQITSLREVEEEQQARLDLGMADFFDLANAQNSVLEAVDSLNSAREQYSVVLDQFKIRIGMPISEPLAIIPQTLGLPPPEATITEAIAIALQYRLDMQNERDQVIDSRRDLEIARDDLRADLDFTASANLPTDDDEPREIPDLAPGNSDFSVGLFLSWPLDREIERLNLRQAQISMERAIRNYEEFRDEVAIDVREALREIERALFSLEIQRTNVEIAERRYESVTHPDQVEADSRDKTDALDAWLRAQNSEDSAVRDLEVAILNYLLTTGQLRVAPDGTLQALNGMLIDPQILELEQPLPGEEQPGDGVVAPPGGAGDPAGAGDPDDAADPAGAGDPDDAADPAGTGDPDDTGDNGGQNALDGVEEG